MKNRPEPDTVTAAACEWLQAGGKEGGYSGPDPGDDHDLAPLLSRETGRRGMALLSESIWIRREEAVMPVLRRLGAAGITVWAFKGFDLARSLYPFTGARSMSDIDLFLRTGERGPVLEAFRDHGWTVATPGRGIFASGIVSEVKLRKLDTMAELHSHIFYFPATFPGSLPHDLFRGGRRLAPGLLAFSWHNSLLMVALHALINSWMRPVWWVDLSLLCSKVTETGTWREFTLNATRTRLGPSIHSLLAAVSSNLCAEVPGKVLDMLESQGSDGEAILEGLRKGKKVPTLMSLRYLNGWRRSSWFYALIWMIISRRRFQVWENLPRIPPQL
ncbi:MAG: nucleotidyltransferase family protein [Candidatus Fermentibacteraceae bacterium]|nr:nucleotidyltransferase family protein [Candidatus Fermentibacteraceae bacterium]